MQKEIRSWKKVGAALLLVAAVSNRAEAVARWEVAGPEGGRVVALAFDAAGISTLYAALDEGGVWRSADGGASWVAARGGLPSGSIRTLAADPSVPGTIYIGRDGDGIWKSSDGGQTWTNRASQLGGQPADIRRLRFDPASGTLWAGLLPRVGQASVYRSEDGGTTWAAVDLGVAGVEVTSIAFGGSDVFVGSATNGLFRGSPDGGSWDNLLTTAQIRTLAFTPGSLYASSEQGFLVSHDRGANWTTLLTPPIPIPGRPTGTLYLGEIALSPADPQRIYVGFQSRPPARPELTGGLFRSVDGGATFAALGSPYPAEMPQALLFEPGPAGRLLAGPGALGVWASPDGNLVWSRSNLGLRAAPTFRVLADPKRPAILFASVEDVGTMKTEDGGATWRSVPLGATIDEPLALDPRQPATVYAYAHDELSSAHLFKGTNGGRRWTSIESVFPGIGTLEAFALDEARPDRLFAAWLSTNATIQRSLDGGASWRQSTIACLQPHSLAVAKSGELYVGGSSGCGRVGEIDGGFYRSDDGGLTFVRRVSGLPGRPIAYELATDPARPATVFAGVRALIAPSPGVVVGVDGIYRTRDRAESWTPVTGAESLGVPTTDFAFAPVANRAIWFSTLGRGVWRSGDAGESFREVTTPGLPTGKVYDLDFDRRVPATLYAATAGGLFRYADN